VTLAQQFFYLILSPSEAMKDIAWKPSYDGISLIVALEFVMIAIAAALILEKLQISGPHSDTLTTMLSFGLILAPIPWSSYSLSQVGNKVVACETCV
jgi:hypothetical protein